MLVSPEIINIIIIEKGDTNMMPKMFKNCLQDVEPPPDELVFTVVEYIGEPPEIGVSHEKPFKKGALVKIAAIDGDQVVLLVCNDTKLFGWTSIKNINYHPPIITDREGTC
jgi:hypothetical protein